MSGIRLPDSCRFLVNQKKRQWRYNLSTRDHRRFFFWRWCVSLTKFSYWSKFHVNIMTGSGVMRTFFYKGLSINQETKNTPSDFWSISGDWGELEIRENQKCVCVGEGGVGRRGGKITPPPPPPPTKALKTKKNEGRQKLKCWVLI